MEDIETSNRITKIENDSNIEINRNSKGWTFSVKAYGSTPEQIKVKLQQLMATAKEIVLQEEKSS